MRILSQAQLLTALGRLRLPAVAAVREDAGIPGIFQVTFTRTPTPAETKRLQANGFAMLTHRDSPARWLIRFDGIPPQPRR